MDNITSIAMTQIQAALVRSTDLIGGVVFTDRGRVLATDPKTPFVVDPRPARPPV